MAYIVMTLYSYGLHSYGLYSHGLHSYGLHRTCQFSYGGTPLVQQPRLHPLGRATERRDETLPHLTQRRLCFSGTSAVAAGLQTRARNWLGTVPDDEPSKKVPRHI